MIVTQIVASGFRPVVEVISTQPGKTANLGWKQPLNRKMAYNSLDKAAHERAIIDKFLHKYRATAKITTHQQAAYRTQSYDYKPPSDPDMFRNLYTETYYQSVIEISITEDELRVLMDDASEAEELRRQYGPHVRANLDSANNELLLARREKSIRQSNPGVQLAWEKYQMMLKIAGG